MEYRTVRETAEQWNLSPRTVQQLCAQGRVPGAVKFGKSWAVPAGADKPEDGFDGGGFPRPVFPDKAHDGAFRQGKGDVLEGKAGVGFTKPFDFNCLVHSDSSHKRVSISESSSRVRPPFLAISTACETAASARRRDSSRKSSVFFGATKQPLPATV